jgi:hypothetical protein
VAIFDNFEIIEYSVGGLLLGINFLIRYISIKTITIVINIGAILKKFSGIVPTITGYVIIENKTNINERLIPKKPLNLILKP